MVTKQLNRRHMMPCYYAGSPQDSEVTVKERARDSGLKSQSANNTESMRFVSVVYDYVQWLNQSPFRPGQRSLSFPLARQISTRSLLAAPVSSLPGFEDLYL